MRCMGVVRTGAIVLAVLGMLLPSSVLNAATKKDPAAKPAVIDVELQEGGVFEGQLLNAQGTAQANAPVVLHRSDGEVATTITDQSGKFRVEGLRGGSYRVLAGRDSANYRLWAPDTAPPSAQSQALLVSGGRQIRGQGHFLKWCRNPWVIAAVIAAAIAIPVAIHNSGSRS